MSVSVPACTAWTVASAKSPMLERCTVCQKRRGNSRRAHDVSSIATSRYAATTPHATAPGTPGRSHWHEELARPEVHVAVGPEPEQMESSEHDGEKAEEPVEVVHPRGSASSSHGALRTPVPTARTAWPARTRSARSPGRRTTKAVGSPLRSRRSLGVFPDACRRAVFGGEPPLDAAAPKEGFARVRTLDDRGFREPFRPPSLRCRHDGSHESRVSRATLGRIDDVVDLDAASAPTADECRAHRKGAFFDVGRERLHSERGVLDRDRPTRVRRRLTGHSDVAAKGDARRRAPRSTSPVATRSAARPLPIPPRSMRTPLVNRTVRAVSVEPHERPTGDMSAATARIGQRRRREPPRTSGRIPTPRALRGSSGRTRRNSAPELVTTCERTPEPWAGIDVTVGQRVED